MRNRAPLVRARAESTKALYVLSYSCVVVITIIVCAYVRTAVHSSNVYSIVLAVHTFIQQKH